MLIHICENNKECLVLCYYYLLCKNTDGGMRVEDFLHEPLLNVLVIHVKVKETCWTAHWKKKSCQLWKWIPKFNKLHFPPNHAIWMQYAVAKFHAYATPQTSNSKSIITFHCWNMSSIKFAFLLVQTRKKKMEKIQFWQDRSIILFWIVTHWHYSYKLV